MTDDKRYRTKRWRSVRLLVLARDSYRCWYPDCGAYANHCDHIEPAYREMPDSEFFGMHNLRASCKPHNTVRGVVARFVRETEGLVPVAPARTMFGRGRSFSGREPQHVGSSRVDLQACKLEYSIVSPK